MHFVFFQPLDEDNKTKNVGRCDGDRTRRLRVKYTHARNLQRENHRNVQCVVLTRTRYTRIRRETCSLRALFPHRLVHMAFIPRYVFKSTSDFIDEFRS